MQYRVTKLDSRHSWHHDFNYMIEFPKRVYQSSSTPTSGVLTVTESGVLTFDRSRRWFNDTFGWSQDVETRQRMRAADNSVCDTDQYNRKWSWSIKYDEYRIYVAQEAELNWFVLKYPQ